MSTNRHRFDSGFSLDYPTARERFRSSAEALGFRLEAFSISKKGPAGEDLTVDAALLGAERPRFVVVVSSGLHGVEGFFGSAVQLAFLKTGLDGVALPRDAALLLLHALNPYGFAWIRRFDEGNVDLNRNFLIDGEVYQGSPSRYEQLDDLLNPRSAPRYFDPFWPRALWAVRRYGMMDLKQAVVGGQYDFPRGLFFGGHTPSLVQRILAETLPRWLGSASDAIHLDFHTGLGPWATFQLLLEPNLSTERAAWLKGHFGAENVQLSEPDGIAYRTRGGLGPWCEAMLPGCRYDFLCAEFGTYPSLRVLAALRAENQAYHWGAPDDPSTRSAKEWLKEVFAPADPFWRETTVRQGVAIIQRALEVGFNPMEQPSRFQAVESLPAPTNSPVPKSLPDLR